MIVRTKWVGCLGALLKFCSEPQGTLRNFEPNLTEIQSKTLTATFFETGPYADPTKSRNPTILGSGDPTSTQ